MIKRTLYFGNPAYLKTSNQQLLVTQKDDLVASIPIEDIGVVVLDHPQITISQVGINRLLQNNVALISCDEKHMPIGLFLNLDGHSLQSKKFQFQIDASVPLKKQLWQQTIRAKVTNQLNLLEKKNLEASTLRHLIKQIKSGDTTNVEGQAAQYYWNKLISHEFQRGRYEGGLNIFLNYGYAILRGIVARSLVGSGLLPTLGIFHRNQYNAYCLADDMMEPYRPYIDQLVTTSPVFADKEALDKQCKEVLLSLPTIDVNIEGKNSPLMIAIQRTTASLAKCFAGDSDKIIYPILQ